MIWVMMSNELNSSGMTSRLDLPVSGMTCAACATRLEKVLNRLPGVRAEVNFATSSAQLTATGEVAPDVQAAVAAVAVPPLIREVRPTPVIGKTKI